MMCVVWVDLQFVLHGFELRDCVAAPRGRTLDVRKTQAHVAGNKRVGVAWETLVAHHASVYAGWAAHDVAVNSSLKA